MRYIKYSIIICLFFFLITLSSKRTNAAIEIQKRDTMKMSETLSMQSEIYSYPKKIYISNRLALIKISQTNLKNGLSSSTTTLLQD